MSESTQTEDDWWNVHVKEEELKSTEESVESVLDRYDGIPDGANEEMIDFICKHTSRDLPECS